MSNQRRTEESPYVVDFFDGVNQSVNEVNLDKAFVPYLTGAYPTERGAIRRIPGKTLATSGSVGGHVLTLHQLPFRNKNSVLINRAGTMYYEDQLTELQETPDPDIFSPVDRFIFE